MIEEIRTRFKSVMVREPRSLSKVSKEMPIGLGTLVSFVRGKEVSYKTMCLIESWIMHEEERLGMR